MGSFLNSGVMHLNVTGKYRLCLCHAFLFPLNLVFFFPGGCFNKSFCSQTITVELI